MSNSDESDVLAGLPTSPVPLGQCGMADTASLLGDKWMLLILREVSYGVTRFDDLKRELEMSSATLSNRAARLVEIGMLEKREYRVDGSRPRAQYLLTEMGSDFGKVLWAMMEWGDTHLRKGRSPIELINPQSGLSLRLALVDDQGAVTEFDDAQPVVKA